jgi:hypothetical protein
MNVLVRVVRQFVEGTETLRLETARAHGWESVRGIPQPPEAA